MKQPKNKPLLQQKLRFVYENSEYTARGIENVALAKGVVLYESEYVKHGDVHVTDTVTVKAHDLKELHHLHPTKNNKVYFFKNGEVHEIREYVKK